MDDATVSPERARKRGSLKEDVWSVPPAFGLSEGESDPTAFSYNDA
jgi:hypothetical protein